MLKQLFAKIKSEKSKTSSIPESQPSSQPQPQPSPPAFFRAYSLPELKLVPSIPTIHYAVLDDFPDLRISILSCGIHFHQLPYSGRRVKEIYTSDKLPEYAEYLLQTLGEHLHEPNHFLINDYPVGVGIMSHFDGPAYHPKVAVYSMGTAIIRFTKSKEEHRLLLEDKSLHVFEDEAYSEYMHGVADHGIDSVFFKFQDGGVSHSSVVNFQQTNIYSQVINLLHGNPNIESESIGNYQLSRISQNPEYNYQLEVPRTQRISVTIRHKH